MKIPVVLLGKPMDLACRSVCPRASTVLKSGLGAPACTATPSGVWARFTSLPGTLQPSAMRSFNPSRDMMTISADTPRRSWALIALGPPPCELAARGGDCDT